MRAFLNCPFLHNTLMSIIVKESITSLTTVHKEFLHFCHIFTNKKKLLYTYFVLNHSCLIVANLVFFFYKRFFLSFYRWTSFRTTYSSRISFSTTSFGNTSFSRGVFFLFFDNDWHSGIQEFFGGWYSGVGSFGGNKYVEYSWFTKINSKTSLRNSQVPNILKFLMLNKTWEWILKQTFHESGIVSVNPPQIISYLSI